MATVLHGLNPEITYQISVQASDFCGGNLAPPSNVLTVTTSAVSANDTLSPSAPNCCWGGDGGGLELNIYWGHSFDMARMQHELKDIFKRDVDLVGRRGLEHSRKYLRRKEILDSAQVIHVAR